jgi:hypothetical protein
MARAWGRRGAAGRVVFVAALTLAGAGAGASAVLAVSGSALIRAAGGAAGGVAGLCSAAWADAAKQRREGREAAAAERGRMLDPVVSEPADDLSVLGLLLATRENPAPFRGRAGDLTWLQAWCDDPAGHPVALVAGAGGSGRPGWSSSSRLPGRGRGWRGGCIAGAAVRCWMWCAAAGTRP